MDRELRILILEDVPADAELMGRELRKSGLMFSSRRVETREAFLRELSDFAPHLILADYTLPQFDGVSALKIAQEVSPLTPVIIVTASLNEEIAVDCMKTGATDYVLKESLARLGSAVKSALEKKRVQEEKIWAQEALRMSEQQYRLLVENVADGIGIVQARKLVFVNDALASMLDFMPAQLVGRSPVDFLHHAYKAQFRKAYSQLEQGITEPRTWPILQCIVTRDKREVWMEGAYSVIAWEGQPAILIDMRDITERKLREMSIEKERDDLRRQNIQLRSTIKERYRFGDIIGKSQVMQDLYELILKASASEKDVLIGGESGTGKELVARTIHQLSARQDKAFVPVNCGAVPESLFENEFFGHRKGAFTGADRDKQGFFDAAHQGTLFLDEVGELSLNMQVKLLRAIESGEYTPVGDTAARKVDVRIIAASNRNLPEQVEKGLMREDFFYRIHVIVMSAPPLRERKEDIPLLLDHFMQQYGDDKPLPAISGSILEILYNHDWPGNIRQLQNVLYRYLTVGQLNFSGPRSAESAAKEDGSDTEVVQEGLGLRQAAEDFEKRFIASILEQHRWHRGKTAAALKIGQKTLYRKMKLYRLI